jgi:transposase
VQGIAMDMNAQYALAVRNRYPHIKIVYDPFHIIKNYNDRVISELRKAEQRRLTDALEVAQKEKHSDLAIEITKEYKMFKHSRFVLLSNRNTLEAKDAAAKEHNKFLSEHFEKRGLSLPPGERKWATNNLQRLEQVLQVNDNLHTVYVLSEMLKLSFACDNVGEFKTSLDKWLKIASHANIPELNSFCKMVVKYYDGIINHAIFPISNGPLEGTNNLIKTIRRQAYGYRDQQYFFLKIWEVTRKKPKLRFYKSHRFRA